MSNEERHTLKMHLRQRARLYRQIALSLPYDEAWKSCQTWKELDYARTFLDEFRQELHRRAMRAEIASKAIRVEEKEA